MGCWVWYLVGKGIVVMVLIVGVVIVGAFFHVFENLIW